ncbi:MAG: FIST N-terminal domain-containing protein [Cyanobacteria bacterium J06632_22]
MLFARAEIMFKVVVGHSDDADADYAIADVLKQCQAELVGQQPQAGILLSAVDFDYDVMLTAIYGTYPDLQLIGGTTDGEVSSQAGFQQDSVLLVLFASDAISIQAGVGRSASVDPFEAAQQAVTQARQGQSSDPVLGLTVAESLHLNSVSILESLQLVLGERFPLFGGLAGDQARFQQTYQFFNQQVMTDSIPVLLFFGPLKFSYGMAHGWTPISQRGTISAVGKNCVESINNEPALELYDYYLSGLTPSPEYPLAIFEKESDSFYLRAPVGCDRTTGQIQFLVDIPAHVDAQIAHATQEDILKACETASSQALEHYPGTQPAAALMFTCCTRRYLLGTRTEEEFQITQRLLPSALPLAGFYSYGEISPVSSQDDAHDQGQTGKGCLNHETFVLLLLGCD